MLKRGVSGIVAAAMLFTMLFTVGTTYLIAVNQINKLYVRAHVENSAQAQDILKEKLELMVDFVNDQMRVVVTNKGVISSAVVALTVRNKEGQILAYYNTSSTSIAPKLPIFLNPLTSETINTDVVYSSATQYQVKLLTERGNIYSATYPPVNNELAARALSSGAIGDLYLDFDSYGYYRVSYQTLYYQGQAFTIPRSFISTYSSAFSVVVTNLNAAQKNIILDGYTRIFQFWGVGSSMRRATWYIVSNQSNTILNTYTPIELEYDKPKVLVFASRTPYTFQPVTLSGDEVPPSGTLAGVLILSHGWIGVDYSQIWSTPANYGQNSPYVTTLYSG
ncbi:MAG: hypothetical protein QXE57_04605 [Nitrososphaerales archaeon]